MEPGLPEEDVLEHQASPWPSKMAGGPRTAVFPSRGLAFRMGALLLASDEFLGWKPAVCLLLSTQEPVFAFPSLRNLALWSQSNSQNLQLGPPFATLRARVAAAGVQVCFVLLCDVIHLFSVYILLPELCGTSWMGFCSFVSIVIPEHLMVGHRGLPLPPCSSCPCNCREAGAWRRGSSRAFCLHLQL